MANDSREAILNSVWRNLPANRVALPKTALFNEDQESLVARFESALEVMGGKCHVVGSGAEAARDSHELAGVDVGVVRAQFGVAETGAVWFTQNDLGINALAFLCQHLVVLLDPKEIVASMHEAYQRVKPGEVAYGCFVAGPSATGRKVPAA